jgi:putative NADH-flavin reductase
MKTLIIGANGAIGKLVLEEMLRHNHSIFAYVRKKDSIKTSHKNLTIIEGNLQDGQKLESSIQQVDVVISALGPHMDMSRKVKSTPIADGHKLIIRLMQKHNKKRFITMGTPTIQFKDDVKHYTNTLLPWIPRILFPTGYKEYRLIGEIMNSSDLDWTVVRFLDPKAKHINNNYEVRLDGKTTRLMISRENIAHFINKVASEDLYIRQMPLIFH